MRTKNFVTKVGLGSPRQKRAQKVSSEATPLVKDWSGDLGLSEAGVEKLWFDQTQSHLSL